MSVITQGIVSPRSPHYHSRLRIIIAKEIGDIFQRSFTGWILVGFALLVIPYDIAQIYFTQYKMRDAIEFSSSPFMQNMTLRSAFSTNLWIAAIFGPFMVAMTGRQKKDDAVLEPLIATATRRRELVVGRLIAFATAWFGVACTISIMLALAPNIPLAISCCPFLGYFHPGPKFFLEFVVGWTLGGCSLFAMVDTFVGQPIKSKPVTLAIFLIIALFLTARFPGNELLASLVPVQSAISGVAAAFANLPLDPRVHLPPGYINTIWHNKNIWADSVIGDVITTAALVALYARSLRDAVSASNTSK